MDTNDEAFQMDFPMMKKPAWKENCSQVCPCWVNESLFAHPIERIFIEQQKESDILEDGVDLGIVAIPWKCETIDNKTEPRFKGSDRYGA